MTDIPTTEPAELRAGDTWKWRREDLADYPAPTWVLKYRFKNAAGGFEVVAAADGTAYAITVAAATSANYVAGSYSWSAWVEGGSEVYTIGYGEITVLPNLRAGTATAALDGRSHVKKVLDALEAVIERKATHDHLQVSIDGKSVGRMTPGEILTWRDKYRAEWVREKAAERLRKGQGGGAALLVRM